MKMYEHQEDALVESLSEVTFGAKDVIVEAQTGFGKSLLMANMAKELDGIVVIMVNIEPLIDQIAEHLTAIGEDFSILKAGREKEFDENHKVQIIMSQTFYARKDKINLYADYLIIDEAHREFDTERTTTLIKELKPKSIIRLSATPYDRDGYALRGDAFVKTKGFDFLIENGFSTPVKYYVPQWTSKIKYDSIPKHGGDYSAEAIEELVTSSEYIQNCIGSMNQMRANEKRTLVFCSSILHCEIITKELKRIGYRAECIHSEKKKSDNESIMNRFKNPNGSMNLIEDERIDCLVSVGKLNVGFDVKDVQLGVMIRPTKILSLYMQTVGRMVRVHKDKPFAEFLDLAGTVEEHGFHTEPYTAPSYGEKELLTKEKEKRKIKHIPLIVAGNEPIIQVNREIDNKIIKELQEARNRNMLDMTFEQLIQCYESTDFKDIASLYVIACAISLKIKGQKTVNLEKLEEESLTIESSIYSILEDEPTIIDGVLLKSCKTRMKNLVKEGKTISDVVGFAKWFCDKNK